MRKQHYHIILLLILCLGSVSFFSDRNEADALIEGSCTAICNSGEHIGLTDLVKDDNECYSLNDPQPERPKVKITTRIKASESIYFSILPPDSSFKPQLNSKQRFPLTNIALCCSDFAVSQLRGPPSSALS